MERALVQYILHDNLQMTQPHAHTPAGWLTFGFAEDLDEAIAQALEGMLALLKREYQLDKREALSLASVAVDLRLTQIVNGVCGVHALLPHGVIF